ncbi:MAG: malonyl-CoA decarboxylase [Pseudomonadota bacterium]
MSLLGDLMTSLFERGENAGFDGKVDGQSIEELCEALLTSRGEVSGTGLAAKILGSYVRMNGEQKQEFFAFLTHGLDLDLERVEVALTAYRQDRDPGTYHRLMQATEPRRQELARRLNQLPGATEKLVAMRRDLKRYLKEHPDLMPLDLDFRHLFKSWFNRGFLVLRPISWESPAHILEKIIAYEAVHEIHSWEDLRRRVEPRDRRCFAYFHPSMPDEPLIFVEVALTRGIANSIQDLLAEERVMLAPSQADTAVFYSISNCQEGLAGISFGNSLIKQVVRDLSRALPGLKTFVTLSPVPRLMDWLSTQDKDAPVDPEDLRITAAHYLTKARNANDMPLDPVARFHLTNGAMLHDIHAGADLSENGMAQSAGIMVNYLYNVSQIDKNHEAFVADRQIAASKPVKSLANAYEAGQAAD